MSKSKWFCLKKNSDNASIQSSISSSTSNKTLITNTENELKIKAREKAVSKKLNDIKRLMEVDLCFVLDCTGTMGPHITAAKDCILQVSSYVKHINPNIKLRVGFCGYRDHDNGIDRLQVLDFTDQYEKFTQYMQNVTPIYNLDLAEDVLGGLNAAVTQMNWQNSTRVLLHIGDYPPHGRRFSYLKDNYPNGDPNGLTAEDVLGKMQSNNILYFFGRITNHTDKMLEIFHDIIGEFPVFDLVGGDPLVLIDKFIQATSSSITYAVSLTSTIVSSSNEINSMQRKK